MHHTDVADASVDPNGSGAKATVENNSRDEILFAVGWTSELTGFFHCRVTGEAKICDAAGCASTKPLGP